MRAVIGAEAQVIELIVVLAREPLRAIGILPDPFLKVVFQFLLAFAGGQGLVLVDDEFGLAIGTGDFVVGGGGAVVEGVLDQHGGGEPGRAVGSGVGSGVFGLVAEFDGPTGDALGVRDCDVFLFGRQQFTEEALDIGYGYPRGTQARVDIAGFEIAGLHGAEGVYIRGELGRNGGSGFGDFELAPDIAGKVGIGGFPGVALGIAEHQAGQFVLQSGNASLGETRHAEPIDLPGFIQADEQRLSGGFDVFDGLVAFDGALMKDGRFGGAPGVRIVVFEREQERVIGIAGKGAEVLFRGDGTEAVEEAVVFEVELAAGAEDLVFAGVFQLGAQHFANGIAHG